MKRKLKKLFNSDSVYYSGSSNCVDHNVKDDSKLDLYKKHQKDKKCNSDSLKKRNIDSLLNNRSILGSKVSDVDSNFIYKHMHSENNFPSSSINLRDSKGDGTAAIFRQEHLVRGISAGMLRKKSKRDNDVQSCLKKVKDYNDQIANCIDSSSSKEVIFRGSPDKKRKNKKDQATNDLRYVNTNQVPNNQTIQSLNTNNIHDHKQKKHKKVKEDRSKSSLEKIVNNTVNDISNNYERVLDDPLSTGSSKEKHNVISVTSDNIEAKNDVNTSEAPNYFTSNQNDTEHDMSHRKKHNKRKHKDSNVTEGLENGNQKSNSYNILCLNDSVSGGNLMKKHKKNKEHVLTTTVNHLTDYTGNKIADISEEQYLDASLRKKHKNHKHISNNIETTQDVNIVEIKVQELPSNETSDTLSKKKHKKPKHISNGVEAKQDVNIAEKKCQEYELPSNETSNVLSKKKHKKHKHISNSIEIIQDVNISKKIYQELLSNETSDTLSKKKHKKHKHISNDHALQDVNIAEKKCQDFELPSDQTSNILSTKKHKKHKHISNGIEAIQDVNISEKKCQEFELPSNETSDTLSKKKHKKHKHISNGTEVIHDVSVTEKKNEQFELPSNETFDVLSMKTHKKHRKKSGDELTQDLWNTGKQIFENHDSPYLNESALSSHTKKKNKKDRENSLVTFGNFIDKTVNEVNDISKDQHLESPVSNNSPQKKHTDSTDYSVNKITDISEEQYLDATLRKKHKKHKRSSSAAEAIEDANITENCQDFELPSNEMPVTFCKRKHKKYKKNKGGKSTKDSENKDNQIFENRDVPYLNEPVLSSYIQKKDKEKNLISINNFVDKTAVEVTSNSDNHHLKFLNSNNSLKKVHKRHNDTGINSCDSSTTIRDTHSQVSSYEDSFRDESVIDTQSKQKHKKDHVSKIVNITSSFNDTDQNPSCNNDMYMNLHNSKALKKKKRNKEKKVIIAMTDPVQDTYEVSYLDNSRSDSAHKKKHKKCKINDSSIDKDLDQLLSNCETQVSDYAAIKKHKNMNNNSKDSTSVNQTGHKVSNNSEVAYSDNFSCNKQNKSINVIQNGYDLNETRNSYMINRDQISLCTSNNERNESDSLKQKKRSKKKEIITAVIDNREQIPSCTSNKERSESDSNTHTNDSVNVEKSKEPCKNKNAIEIIDNISEEDENLKENKSIDLDFTEEDVDFEIPLLHANENMKNLSEKEKKKIISQGVHIKTGKFSQEEDAIILKNIENFLKTYDTLDISDVLGIGRLKRDSYFTKFLRAKHFYARLGKGLNDRTLISIYKRARRLIHPYQNKKKFQETEIRSLKFLRKVVNKKWICIADTLGRTEDSCLQAYRWHAKGISHGKWTEEEEQQLIAAIKKITGSSDLSCEKLKGISWDEVATHVPTRNFSQCRMHWAFHLAWKPGALKHKWDKNCSKKLIDILRNEWYVENASEIDWLKVYEAFVDVAPSHIFLQKRWLTLRYQIKGFKTLSYRDTIDILFKEYNSS